MHVNIVYFTLQGQTFTFKQISKVHERTSVPGYGLQSRPQRSVSEHLRPSDQRKLPCRESLTVPIQESTPVTEPLEHGVTHQRIPVREHLITSQNRTPIPENLRTRSLSQNGTSAQENITSSQNRTSAPENLKTSSQNTTPVPENLKRSSQNRTLVLENHTTSSHNRPQLQQNLRSSPQNRH